MKLLCLQSTSIFDRYGGVEYYLNDLLQELAKRFGDRNVTTIVPISGHLRQISPPKYQVNKVTISSRGIWRKFDNRFPIRMFFKAIWIAWRTNPDLILGGHVSLGPLAFLLSKITRRPYVLVAYGIDVWGKLYPQDEWCLRQAHAIVSISYCTKNILINVLSILNS